MDVDGVRHRLRCPCWVLKVSSRRYPPDYPFFLVIYRVISTIQFVGISAFHTRISDPTIGGTYMTVRPRNLFLPVALRLLLNSVDAEHRF